MAIGILILQHIQLVLIVQIFLLDLTWISLLQDLLTTASGRTSQFLLQYNRCKTKCYRRCPSKQDRYYPLIKFALSTTLTYEGDPGEVFALQESDLWTVRGNKTFTDTLPNGDTFYMQVDDVSGNTDFTDTPTNPTFNKQHTVYDPRDGYIDFTFDTLTPSEPYHHLNP